jgi:hypothetical protein
MWRRVDLLWTAVSEEYIASIFRVEKSASEEPALAQCMTQKWTELNVTFLRQDDEGYKGLLLLHFAQRFWCEWRNGR